MAASPTPNTPFTRYNRLSNPLSNGFDNRFDNRVERPVRSTRLPNRV